MPQALPIQPNHYTFPLSFLLIQTAGIMADFGPQFLHYSQNFVALTNRYSWAQFHLAVLDQFKRGKSTLLNALTGKPIPPFGTKPLADTVKRRSLEALPKPSVWPTAWRR
jgi:hypothetical protein